VNLRGRAPIDEKLREGTIAATDVYPSQPRLGSKPANEDIARQLTPGSHHLFVGSAVIETDGSATHPASLRVPADREHSFQSIVNIGSS
jgi:hypothetical protein